MGNCNALSSHFGGRKYLLTVFGYEYYAIINNFVKNYLGLNSQRLSHPCYSNRVKIYSVYTEILTVVIHLIVVSGKLKVW